MKRWDWVLALVGLACVAFGVHSIYRGMHGISRQDSVIVEGGCRTPVTVLAPEGEQLHGSAVVLHGLSANRRIMQPLGSEFAWSGLRVYLFDLAGHGDNTDHFMFGPVQKCAEAALESLIRSGRIDPRTTILVGHSMGGSIAIRMADREPVLATIAISPGPASLPQRMPANLLVFSAQLDIGLLKQAAQRLAEAAGGGSRARPDDFAQLRAFDLQYIPHATHTSLLANSRVIARSLAWAEMAIHPVPSESGASAEWKVPVNLTSSGAAIGLVGLMLLFPLCATVAGKLAAPPRAEIDDPYPSRLIAIGEYAAVGLVSVGALSFMTPLKFIHLYTADYLASLLLISGALLLILNWRDSVASYAFRIPRQAAAAALGFATILGFGAWLNWQLDDAWLNAPRWLRFAGLLPFMWIYSYAEEVVLGPVRIGKRRAWRFAFFLLFRLELWVACAIAAYKLTSGQILIVILFTFLALFSILQRLATDALRLRTGSATAAALFGAILASWFVSAVFPLT